MKRYRFLSILLTFIMLFSLSACGEQTIEGDWVLVREVWGDGTITFAAVTLKGNKFQYTVGEGDDASTMYFERQ